MEDVDADSHPVVRDPLFISNMSTPCAEGSGDPCVALGAQLLPPDEEVQQLPVPLKLRIAKKITEQMETYDQHARQIRGYYALALEKERALTGVEGGGSRTGMADGGRDPRTRNKTTEGI